MNPFFHTKIGLVSTGMERIFKLDFGVNSSNELNSPPAVSARVFCGVAEPGGLPIF